MELATQQNLTLIEQSELSRLEAIIEKGQFRFIEVGNALMEIRDSDLYKEYGTFERYCKERWEFNSSRARQLISSAKVNENLKSVTTVTPTSEWQTRPLTHLEPDQQKEAWKKAVETAPEGKVTAAIVSKVVKEMTNESTEKIEPKKDPKREVTEAKQFATIAISQLERIRLNDPRREEQLTRVLNWIIKNKGGKKS